MITDKNININKINQFLKILQDVRFNSGSTESFFKLRKKHVKMKERFAEETPSKICIKDLKIITELKIPSLEFGLLCFESLQGIAELHGFEIFMEIKHNPHITFTIK